MVVCVIGGTGFIGSTMCHELLEMGLSVVSVSRSLPLRARKNVKYLEVSDPLNRNKWLEVLNDSGAEIVINLASSETDSKSIRLHRSLWRITMRRLSPP